MTWKARPGFLAELGAHRVERVAEIAATSPWRVLLSWTVVVCISLVGIALLEVDTTTASFLDRRGAAWATYERSIQRHGGDEFVVLGLPAHGFGDRDALAAVQNLSRDLARLPSVRRVDSVATMAVIRSDGRGGILVDPLVAGGLPESDDELLVLERALSQHAGLLGSVVSTEGDGFAVNVVLDEDVEGDRDLVVRRIAKRAAAYGADITGVPVFRTAINYRTTAEILAFVPITLLLIGLLVLFVMQSIQGVVLALTVALISSACSLGAMGLSSSVLSLSTLVLPSTLLALGCAYSFHVVVAVSRCVGEREVADAAAGVAVPVALSAVTTTLGFLAMSTVPIQAIRDLAVFGAVGVLAAGAAAITVVPSLAALWPVPGSASAPRNLVKELASVVVVLASRHRAWSLAAWAAVLLGVLLGASNLRVATDVIQWFPVGSDVRDEYERVRERFSGITPVNVLVESVDNRSVIEPEGVALIRSLEGFLDGLPQVGHSTSIVDSLDAFDRLVSGSMRSFDPNAAEQYMVVLSGYPALGDLLSVDRSSASVALRLNDNSSDSIVEVAELVEEWRLGRAEPGYTVATTGVMYEFARSEEAIAYGQLKGLALAAIAIALLLWLVYRSPSLALAAAVSSLVPVSAAFGAMGALGIPLDAATVCLGSLALGIAVDDSIHLVSRFWQVRSLGGSRREALLRSMERVLLPVVTTTMVIVVGFGVLGASGFTLIRNLGLVTAGVVFLCMVADFTLLPALLWGIPRRGDVGELNPRIRSV